jgi:hypothetical protein
VPELKSGGWRRAFSPNHFWFYLFSRQGTATQYFTIHVKVAFPARIALAAFASQTDALSTELRENGGGSRYLAALYRVQAGRVVFCH